MTSTSPIFEEGEGVLLHGIKARPELNGTHAEVVAFDEASQRYAVRLDGSGEKVRIKGSNLRADADPVAETPPPSPSVAETPPPSPYHGLRDLTLFVVDGKLMQPAVAAEFSIPPSDPAPSATPQRTVHRLHLPAGSWEVRCYEQEPSAITVVLHAGEGEASTELRGLSCTRTAHLAASEDALSPGVSVVVEGGALVVSVPHVLEVTVDPTGETLDDALPADPMDIDDLDIKGACSCPSCLKGFTCSHPIRPHRQKATMDPDASEQPYTDPDAVQRWTAEELYEASLGMPPVCIAGC